MLSSAVHWAGQALGIVAIVGGVAITLFLYGGLLFFTVGGPAFIAGVVLDSNFQEATKGIRQSTWAGELLILLGLLGFTCLMSYLWRGPWDMANWLAVPDDDPNLFYPLGALGVRYVYWATTFSSHSGGFGCFAVPSDTIPREVDFATKFDS